VAFAFTSGVAIADGTKVVRFDVGAFDRFAAGGGRFAVSDVRGIRVFDAQGSGASIALGGIRAIAIDSSGRLFAATVDTVYSGTGADLEAIAHPGQVHDVVSSAMRTWVLTDDALLAIDRTSTMQSALTVEAGAHLVPSSTGDVWVLGTSGLRRYTIADGGVGGPELWQQTIAPIVDKSCSSCHLPDGSAHIDLSTYEAWLGRHDQIVQRVVVERTMPPAGGRPITDEDREAIRVFTSGN
jgi:hypothetical protein